MRNVFAVTALAVGAVVLTRAAADVTFILTDGTRVTGEIASMSEPSEGMPEGELNLESRGMDERSFGLEMVAVIDFAGGAPNAEELEALPSRGHLLALTNGTRTIGRLEDMRNGQLRWRGTSGQPEYYPLNQVARVYLDAEAARRVYEDAVAEAAASNVATMPGAIAVVANRAWTDAGIQVRPGQRFRFQVAGQIRFGPGADQVATADGNATVRNRRLPVPALPIGGLIVRVNQDDPMPVGTGQTPITFGRGGRMQLGINDTNFGDNAGAFQVVITRVR